MAEVWEVMYLGSINQAKAAKVTAPASCRIRTKLNSATILINIARIQERITIYSI